MADVSQRLAELSWQKRELVEEVLRREGVDPWTLPIRPRAPGRRDLPLAYTQESLWFMCQLAANNGVYNLPAAVQLQGPLRRAVLEQALREIVRRHEILRTRFPVVAGRPVQEVLGAVEVQLTFQDCCHLPENERRHHALGLATQEAARPFDLAERPPWRMSLYALGPEDHLLLVAFHHLVWDGWSVGVWMRELAVLYQAFSNGQPSPLPELPIQYADYAIFEREWLSGERVAAQMDYWRRQLRGLEPLALTLDRPRSARPTFTGGSEAAFVPPEVGVALDELCRRTGVTPYMAMLAVFQVVLHRYTGCERVAVGTPIAGRRRRELEGLLGTLANIVVMATDLSGDPVFLELLARVREVTTGAYAHQDVPFEMLVDKLQVERNASSNPLFQVMFALHQEKLAAIELPGLRAMPVELGPAYSHFDLGLHFWRHEDGFAGFVSYNSDLFEPSTIRRLIGHFQVLLAEAVRAPERRISSLPLLTQEEQRWVAERSALSRLFTEPPCGDALFATCAEDFSGAVACVCGDSEVSYGELASRVDRLARHLRQLKLGVVGLALPRGVEGAVAVLGALRAGVPFVPLDAAGSARRRAQVLEAIGPMLVLTTRLLAPALEPLGLELLCLDEPLPDAPAWQGAVLPDAPAYFLCAAEGPRAISRRQLARRLERLSEVLPLAPGEAVLTTAPGGRDFFAVELLWPLTRGAAVVFAGPSGSVPGGLRPLVGAHVTPTGLAVLLQQTSDQALRAFEGLRWVACSGALLRPELANEFQRRLGVRLMYLYSPPEIGAELAFCTWESREQRDAMPAGRAEGLGTLVLDARGGLVPIGIPGTIHATLEGITEHRPVRTADRGMWLADGSLRVLGGVDARHFWHEGLRLDLSELEEALLGHPAIYAVHALARTRGGHDELAVYLVASGRVELAQIEEHIRSSLPEASLPVCLVLVNALPLTEHGQVDARALAALPVVDARAAEAWERQLASIPGVKALKVLIQERLEPQKRVHISELLPDLRAGQAAERHTSSTSGAMLAGQGRGAPQRLAHASGGPLHLPDGAPRTLTEAFVRTAEHFGDHGLTLLEGGASISLSYRELLHRARCVLTGLRERGGLPGQRVILQIEELEEHFVTFWACLLGGITPVTVATASAYERRSGVVSKLYNVWKLLGGPVLLASARLVEPLGALPGLLAEEGLAAGAFKVVSIDELSSGPPADVLHPAQPGDVAFLQLSSGSTGTPKCIQLTHEGIIDFIHGAREVNGFGPEDVNVNWLPMDHVGPILTCHLKDTYLGSRQVHLKTELVLADPLRWLDALDTYRGNFSWSPNFGYKLVNDALARSPGRRWELSCVRRLLNGGEQVTVPVAEEFLQRMAAFGLHPGAMQPSFGMAEVCTCICYANDWTPGTGAFRVRKSSLSGELEEALEGDTDVMAFVDLGPLRPGVEVRIVGLDGSVLPERVIGVMQVRGRSVMPGYLHNEEANREALVGDGWLSSGDLGFLREGRLTITGRQKETLVIRGANFYCYEIEDAVSAVEGVEPSFVAACSVDDPSTGTDGIALFFSPRRPGLDVPLLRAIRERVSADFGLWPAYLIPIDRESFPKTTSGKVQRTQLKRDLVQGRFDELIQRIDLASDSEKAVPEWFLRPVWQRQELPPRPVRPERDTWLLLGRDGGLSDAVVSRLGSRAVVRVWEGKDFSRVGPEGFTLDPCSPEHYDALLAALAEEGHRIGCILHLWAYGDPGPEPRDVEELVRANTAATASLLLLVQALSRSSLSRETLQIIIAASHASSGSSGRRVAYERASLRALAKVIPQEWAALSCQHVELPADEAGEDAERLLAEARVATKEREVRYSGMGRFVPRLEPVRPVAQEKAPWQRGDLVVVTGGLGGVGVELARHLMEAHGLRLLLVGRTPLEGAAGPDGAREVPAEWQSTQERRRAFDEFASSERVVYEAVDVANLAGMREAVSRAERRFGVRLAGAFHLAGVLPTRLLAEETPESFAQTVYPKLAGGWVLRQLLGEEGFLVCFGSAYGIFGGAAVGAYAAASCALEALLAEELRLGRARRFVFSFSHWEELGMSRGYQLAEQSLQLGYAMVGRRRGLSSLEAGLRSGRCELVIGLDTRKPHVRRRVLAPTASAQRLAAYVERSPGTPALELPAVPVLDRFGVPVLCDIVEVAQMPRLASGEIDTAVLAGLVPAEGASRERILPRTGLERTIAAIWREVLRVDAIDVNTSFFALGGQSVLLIQVLSRLHAALDRELSVVELFRYPTVSSLASHLERTEAAPRRSIQKAAQRAQKQKDAVRQRLGARPRGGTHDRRGR